MGPKGHAADHGTQEKKFSDLVESAAKYFTCKDLVRGFTADDFKAAILGSKEISTRYLGPIDWTWGKDDTTIDSQLAEQAKFYEQRCNQVEFLLHEAGLLMDRSLNDLSKYDDLNMERFKIMMEFIEYAKINKQQDVEYREKEYWDALRIEAELSGTAAATTYKYNINPPSRGDLPDPGAGKGIDYHYKNATGLYLAAGVHGGSLGNPVGETGYASGHSTQAAWFQNLGSAEAAASEMTAHATRAKYEGHARDYQLDRQDITRTMIGLKMYQLLIAKSTLNYNDRLAEIGDRAYTDFQEVYGRLRAIAAGLREFYTKDGPSEADLQAFFGTSRTRIEAALKWVRKAANAFSRATLDEQQCVVRVTVQSSGGGKLIKELLSKSGMSVPSPSVGGMNIPRLRGISATAEGLEGDSWVDLEVTCPKQALTTVDVTLPPVTVRLGRVSSSASLNLRDVVGPKPIINRSPVSSDGEKWNVRALGHDRANEMTRLHLDFHVSFSGKTGIQRKH